MSRYDRHSDRRRSPSRDRDRSPDARDNDNYDDERGDRYRDNRESDRQEKEDQQRARTKGRWKDAGGDQVKIDRRVASQEHMSKVMRLFEDSLTFDKAPLRDKDSLYEDIRERLDELKRAYNHRLKEKVTSHWTGLTNEGQDNRSRGGAQSPKSKPRPAKSGMSYVRERTRYDSGDAKSRIDVDDSDESPRRRYDDNNRNSNRPANSSDVHNRSRNRVSSGDRGYDGYNRHQKDSPDKRDNSPRRQRDNTPDHRDNSRDRRDNSRGRRDVPYNTSNTRSYNPRGQTSGDLHNRNRNRLRSSDTRR